MNKLRSILLVTDLSDAALPALQRSAHLASELQAGLTVLTGAADGPANPWRDALSAPGTTALALQRTRRLLHRLAREVRGPCELRLMADGREGDAMAQIGRAAAQADLLVLGSPRGNPLRAWLLGTPAERVLRIARRPVLVVKQAPPLPASPYRRVLLPLDLADDGAQGAGPAIGLASRVAPDASLHLLHAVNVPMESRLRLAGCTDELLRAQRQRTQAARLHQLWSMAASLPRQRVFASVGEGQPCGLALKKSRELSADLIVVGKQGRSALGDFLLGSTARRLLAEAEADVLVIPQATGARLDAAKADGPPGPVRAGPGPLRAT